MLTTCGHADVKTLHGKDEKGERQSNTCGRKGQGDAKIRRKKRGNPPVSILKAHSINTEKKQRQQQA